MSYIEHPSLALQNIFKLQPWQGANPMEAKYIFLGLDANFAVDVEAQVPEIIEYLKNGPGFWRNTGKHHPFLLDTYSGNGSLYHENFRLIGFKPAEAGEVSFVELIEKPTTGRSNLTTEDLCTNHIKRLRSIIDHGAVKYIFMPHTAITLLKRNEHFRWLRGTPVKTEGDLSVWRENPQNGQTIYEMYHLSNYGRYNAKLKRQIKQVKKIVISERKGV